MVWGSGLSAADAWIMGQSGAVDDSRPTFWNGGSLFDTSGRRLNEIDWDTYRHPKPVADWAAEDWAEADAALRAFERERGIR